jgi:hypothetical protein
LGGQFTKKSQGEYPVLEMSKAWKLSKTVRRGKTGSQELDLHNREKAEFGD